MPDEQYSLLIRLAKNMVPAQRSRILETLEAGLVPPKYRTSHQTPHGLFAGALTPESFAASMCKQMMYSLRYGVSAIEQKSKSNVLLFTSDETNAYARRMPRRVGDVIWALAETLATPQGRPATQEDLVLSSVFPTCVTAAELSDVCAPYRNKLLQLPAPRETTAEPLYYGFSLFKNPVYQMAWNAVLALHTFRLLSVENKQKVEVQTLILMQQGGLASGCPFYLYCLFLAFGLAEVGFRPAINDPHARWYPVNKPKTFLAPCEDTFPIMVAKVRDEVRRDFGLELPDFTRLGGDLRSILWGEGE